MPLATVGESVTIMSGEVHCPTSCGLPPATVSSKAIMLPCGMGPALQRKLGVYLDGGPKVSDSGRHVTPQ